MRAVLTITFGATVEAVTVEAVGPQGPTCLSSTRPYEEALGLAGDRQLKHADFAPQILVKPAAKVGIR